MKLTRLLPLALLLTAVAAAPAQAHSGHGGTRAEASAPAPAKKGKRGTLRTFRGRLEVRHSDTFGPRGSRTRYTLRQGGRRRVLRPAAPPPRSARSGSRVVVRGRTAGSAIRGRIRSRGPLARAAAAPLGSRKTAVILFNFSGDGRQPWTPDQVRARIFTDSDSMNAFYVEQSYDQVRFVGRDGSDGDVYGWHTISASGATCDPDTWATQARAAVTGAGGSLTGYQHVIYLFPEQASCGWLGLGELPGDESWLNGDLSVATAAHELGHNLGVHHASSLRCTEDGLTVPIGASCTTREYGDPFDVMGWSSNHSNAWHLEQLGYLTSSNIQTITASGQYTVRSAISQSPEVQSLRIPRRRDSYGNVIDYYYLEFRTPGGVFDAFSPTAAVVNGVSIRVSRDPSSISQSKLLDTVTTTSTFTDSALAVGRTFSDGAITVTTTAISGLIATVDVTVGAVDSTPPAAASELRALAGPAGVDLSWAAATDNIGVTGYRVTRNGVSIGTTGLTSYRDSGAVPGASYTYRVIAYDAAGNATESAPIVATAPLPADETAPTVPTGLRASVLGGEVALDWNPSADDRELAHYEVLRDGELIATPPTSAFRDRSPAAGDEHEYRVAAIDAAGNRSELSDPLFVDVQSADRPLQVSIHRPVHRSRVRGVVPIVARASHGERLRRLELWIDGRRRRVTTERSLRLRWNTGRLRRGSHRVLVRALDTGGDEARRTVKVLVRRVRR